MHHNDRADKLGKQDGRGEVTDDEFDPSLLPDHLVIRCPDALDLFQDDRGLINPIGICLYRREADAL